MKKLILIAIMLFITSCSASKEEITDAKKEIFGSWVNVESDVKDLANSNDEIQVSNETNSDSWENLITDKNYFKVTDVSQNNKISVENISNIETLKDKLDLTWSVNDDSIDKIEVVFENRDSSFPKDNYELKTFKKWDKNFNYKAYKSYSVLDLWLNTYTINAYSKNILVATTEVKVYLTNKKVEVSSWSLVVDEKSLPINENYWELSKNASWAYIYSQVENFSFSKQEFSANMTCDNIWDYLQTLGWYYYYNSCIPFWENSFSVNVLTLNTDATYTYSKIYFNTTNFYYAQAILETWTWITV